MSYDNSKSVASSNARGRVARAGEKGNDREAESEGLNSPKSSSSGGQPSTNVSTQEQGSGARGGSSPSEGSGSGGMSSDQRGPNSDDMDGLSSGNDSGERESEGGMERDGGSRGRQSTRSSHSSSNGKDSGMMLETTESNKRYNKKLLFYFDWISRNVQFLPASNRWSVVMSFSRLQYNST